MAGVLSTLGQLIKDGSRELMLPLTPSIWRHVSTLLTTSPSISSNVLARKLSMKVAQRAALTLLDPTRISATAAAVRASRTRGTAPPAASAAEEVLALTQDGMEIVPAVIDTLLAGLRDGDTVVRWSAAKGLGRIAVRLPAQCTEDINDALLELFSPIEMDSGWQGACLALAEVVRHGLLPPSRLPEVSLPATAVGIEVSASMLQSGIPCWDQPSPSCLPSETFCIQPRASNYLHTEGSQALLSPYQHLGTHGKIVHLHAGSVGLHRDREKPVCQACHHIHHLQHDLLQGCQPASDVLWCERPIRPVVLCHFVTCNHVHEVC